MTLVSKILAIAFVATTACVSREAVAETWKVAPLSSICVGEPTQPQWAWKCTALSIFYNSSTGQAWRCEANGGGVGQWTLTPNVRCTASDAGFPIGPGNYNTTSIRGFRPSDYVENPTHKVVPFDSYWVVDDNTGKIYLCVHKVNNFSPSCTTNIVFK